MGGKKIRETARESGGRRDRRVSDVAQSLNYRPSKNPIGSLGESGLKTQLSVGGPRKWRKRTNRMEMAIDEASKNFSFCGNLNTYVYIYIGE